MELNAPEVICRNEKRMLQEAVDALIDNSARRGQGVVVASTGQKRQLKSLADMLKGKQGRFRQNLLGKRVDYSGRSVIVVGPELKLHQCGVPKKMALELFKPFVIRKLIENEIAYNVRGAGRLIEESIDEVWAMLEEVIQDRCVLLNRAPTLHRLGVQAFKPLLIEGHAIQIHPMVCMAFNADFDGDQMAVHVPLSEDAQREAREIMLSSKNLFKPATGESIVVPTKDIVLGCYFMTTIQEGAKGGGKIFANPGEAILVYQFGEVDPKAKIKLRLGNKLVETCIGRILFNDVLPEGFEFVNQELNRKVLGRLVDDLIEKFGTEIAAETLDKIKDLGFYFVTRSGISMGLYDLNVPKIKPKLIAKAEQEEDEIRKQYQQGFLTKQERRVRIIEIWDKTKREIADIIPRSLDTNGPVYAIFNSGSRGSWAQPIQIVGMKGLVINPASEIIELPVKSSLKEGLNVLEYFISTHGARKGTSDTALRTAVAGYLTRRLIDVAQDVIIREEDCGDKEGAAIYREDTKELGISLASRIVGRVSLEEVRDPKTKKTLVKRGELIDKLVAKKIDEIELDKIRVRSIISCKTRFGLCRKCYGYDLGRNKLVEMGEAVGIVTAQAIGEPGTQLTMRTFHTGGIAGGADITQGLQRVEEIFEARPPKGRAALSELDGKVIDIIEKGKQNVVIIAAKKIKKEYVIPLRTGLWVKKGDMVKKGQQLCEGPLDLKELFNLTGQENVQRYILREVQNIYSSQGGGINDKHIEMIVRQMFSRVRVKDSGDTELLPGVVLEKDRYLVENDKAKKKGGKLATCQTLLLGITKVALTTESFLSAASFQETVRVLINAAIEGKIDVLRGLKENVIIGKLIPAGTGFKKIKN
jgi:DNA-directed RNA polymerase subunit beta'